MSIYIILISNFLWQILEHVCRSFDPEFYNQIHNILILSIYIFF